MNRQIHGSWQSCIPSRFLDEIPKTHVQKDDASQVFKFNPQSIGGNYEGFRGHLRDSDPQGRKHGHSQDPLPPARSYTRSNRAFDAGTRIFHMKFGYGNVVSVNGDKLEINFDHSGIKHVVSSFVKDAKDM